MQKILAKLGAIQATLKAPKNQYNSFGGFNYRSCEDILEALKPLLHAQNCVLVLSDELSMIGDRYYITATATIYDTESGESFSNKASARETAAKPKMDDSQVTGTASTYARKYALNGLFCIDDAKDADTDEYQTQNQTQNYEAPAVQKKQIVCPKCGKPVKGVTKSDGKKVSAEDVLKGCGGVCWSCYQADKAK
jgi:hypothetical protein